MADNPLIDCLKHDKLASVDWLITQFFRQSDGFIGLTTQSTVTTDRHSRVGGTPEF